MKLISPLDGVCFLVLIKNRVSNFGHIEFKEGAVYCYDVFTPFAVFLQEFCPHSTADIGFKKHQQKT